MIRDNLQTSWIILEQRHDEPDEELKQLKASMQLELSRSDSSRLPSRRPRWLEGAKRRCQPGGKMFTSRFIIKSGSKRKNGRLNRRIERENMKRQQGDQRDADPSKTTRHHNKEKTETNPRRRDYQNKRDNDKMALRSPSDFWQSGSCGVLRSDSVRIYSTVPRRHITFISVG